MQAKTFTKLLTLFLLCKKKYFFGKAFFKPFRKAFTEIASLKERFVDVREMFSEGERVLLQDSMIEYKRGRKDD